MKFFLDENVNVGCLKPLEALYGDHEFRHAYSEGLGGTKDVPLLNTLQQQGYDAIITKDRTQLRDEEERRAIFDAGLHWIGYVAKGVKGLRGLTTETATLTAGLVYVLADLRPEPHVYKLYGIGTEAAQRVKISAVGRPGWGRPRSQGLGLAGA
ncbi:hypothetical protein MYK68_00195 [Gordonia sp. PP30]|uniref:PIN-like domain-containing protein n=1 Tax=Gordonia sp. PP30 TaxID=2935861 RepID=UPI0020002276|nr:hypothetical protein [Gordonia sp. PP30]UQE75109.1 hypothetical protein MYK68_00195 [Gordonia sp. PP30]